MTAIKRAKEAMIEEASDDLESVVDSPVVVASVGTAGHVQSLGISKHPSPLSLAKDPVEETHWRRHLVSLGQYCMAHV